MVNVMKNLRNYDVRNKNTLSSIKDYPQYTERWIDDHNDGILTSAFSQGGHLPLERVLDIFEGLANGKAYRPETMTDNYYHMRGDMQINREGKSEAIIKYTYHGSSAVHMTLDDLWWLIHVIFDGQDFVEFDWSKQ